MKDLIAKLKSDATCAMGALWIHIDQREARISELESENANLCYELNAALSGGTVSVPGAQVVAEPVTQAWGHITPRDFVEVATAIMDQHGLMDDLTYAKTEKLCEDMEASFKKLPHPVQAPVREVPEWQPIETAPKDGTRVLLQGTPYAMLYAETKTLVGYFNKGWWMDTAALSHVTHWMPLPAAPVQEPKP